MDLALYRSMRRAKGNVIIKAAGNIAYPTGLRTETLAHEIQAMAEDQGVSFEQIAVTVQILTPCSGGCSKPQTCTCYSAAACRWGPGRTGNRRFFIHFERCKRVAELLASADVIIESAIALAQEIHDGPFETFTGHGIWSAWEGSRLILCQRRK